MKRPSTARRGAPPARRSRRARAGGRAPAERSPRLKLKVLLALLLIAGLAFLLRPLLLAALARPLVVSQPFEAVEYLLILDGDRRFDEAARLLREGVSSRVLVVAGRRNRLVRSGLLPDIATLTRRELASRGAGEIPVSELSAGGRPYTGDWDRARAVAGFLQEHPQATVGVLCAELSSRYLQKVHDEVLGERSAQLFWHPLPDRRYDTGSWWRSRSGVLAFVVSYAGLLQVRLVGDGGPTGEVWEPGPWLAAQPGGRMPDPPVVRPSAGQEEPPR